MFSIGQLSKRTGVKVPTIRYYEKLGLIDPPHRSQGNQRRYEPDVLDRLHFIRHGRELGLSIESISQLLDLSSDPERSCAEADLIAREHLASIREKIFQLQQLEKELLRISSQHHKDQIGECYVIQSLSNHKLCLDDHK